MSLAVIVCGVTSFHRYFKYRIEPEISMGTVVVCLSYGLHFESTEALVPVISLCEAK